MNRVKKKQKPGASKAAGHACAECGVSLEDRPKATYCGQRCSYARVMRERQSGKRPKRPAPKVRLVDKKCPACQKVFHPRYKKQKYCGMACSRKGRATQRGAKPCPVCNKTIALHGPATGFAWNRKTCSEACGRILAVGNKPLKGQPKRCRSCKRPFVSHPHHNKKPGVHRTLWRQWCNPCIRKKHKAKDPARYAHKQHVLACRVRKHGKRRKPLGLAVWLRLYDLPCVFCGQVKARRSIDRIDSRRGYMPDNVQPACVDHNLMKSDHTDADFIALCAQVARFRGKRS